MPLMPAVGSYVLAACLGSPCALAHVVEHHPSKHSSSSSSSSSNGSSNGSSSSSSVTLDVFVPPANVRSWERVAWTPMQSGRGGQVRALVALRDVLQRDLAVRPRPTSVLLWLSDIDDAGTRATVLRHLQQLR